MQSSGLMHSVAQNDKGFILRAVFKHNLCWEGAIKEAHVHVPLYLLLQVPMVRTQLGCAAPRVGHIPVVAGGSGTGIAPSHTSWLCSPCSALHPRRPWLSTAITSLPAAGALLSKDLRAARPVQIKLCASMCLLSLASHSKNRGLESASCSARSHSLKCRKLAGDTALLHSKSFPMALVTQRSREFKICLITEHVLMA